MPGGADVERGLHERFADQREHGEWFRRTEGLDAVIAETVSLYGEPNPETGIPELLEDAVDEREFLEMAAEMERVFWRRQIEPLLAKFVRGELEAGELEEIRKLAAQLVVLTGG